MQLFTISGNIQTILKVSTNQWDHSCQSRTTKFITFHGALAVLHPSICSKGLNSGQVDVMERSKKINGKKDDRGTYDHQCWNHFPLEKMHGKMGSNPLLGQAMIIPKQCDFPVLEFLFLGGFEVLALENWSKPIADGITCWEHVQETVFYYI